MNTWQWLRFEFRARYEESTRFSRLRDTVGGIALIVMCVAALVLLAGGWK
jgi:hypothetical protein